jgi:glucan phosphoethanolaminetransferase (alkaline phosphatase superfamily)
MALKLFRTTGYSTLLMPGEARIAPHPARLVLWATLWLSLVCNVGLWRFVLHRTGDWRSTLASVLVVGGVSGIALSLLCWRRTLKLALTFAFIGGALLADGLWSLQLPVEVLWHGPPRTWLPAWASFLRWQAWALVLLLAVLPIVAVWNAQVRRLSGPAQLSSNLRGAVLAGLVLAAGLLLAR